MIIKTSFNSNVFALILLSLLIFSSCENKSKGKKDAVISSTSIIKKNEGELSTSKLSQQRYSIIQSTIAAKGTFKLDSYTGNVYQLVLNANDNETWQLMKKDSSSTPDIKHYNSKNYLLFVSTLAMRFTYLMNVNTGATWQLTEDPTTKEAFFSSFE